MRSRPIDYDYSTGSTFSVKVNGKPVFLLGDFRKKVDASVKVLDGYALSLKNICMFP